MASDPGPSPTDGTGLGCPPACDLERIAGGEAPRPEIAAHIARCEACASFIALARFASQFSNVMSDSSTECDGSRAAGDLPQVFGYRCICEMARGGQGVVYRAVQLTTGRIVAIKVLQSGNGGRSRRARERMAREIETASLLDHPGIVRIVDSLKLPDGRDALVMEFIEGEPLHEWFARRPQASEANRLDMLAHIAEATHHAHQLGVIHRDLKPANILVDAQGRPHLLDFGVARKQQPGEYDTKLTATGEFTGTIAYAAPEQVSGGSDHADVRTDIYALGVIGFEILTGAPPYSVDGPIQGVIDRILHRDIQPSSRSGVSLDAWTVLAKAISKDKGRRYQSAAELAEDLRRAASGEAVLARGDSRWYILRKSARRHRVPLSLLGLVVLGVATTSIALAVGNVSLGRAIDESRLLQIRALLAAGSREQAEVVLWQEISSDLRGRTDPVRAMWSSSKREMQLLWCFVEMQADATCLRVESDAVSPRFGVWPVSSGGFLAASPDGMLIELDARGEFLPMPIRRQIPQEAHSVKATPNGQFLLCWNTDEVWTWNPESGQRIASLPNTYGSFAIAVADWGVALSGATERIAVLSVPMLEPLAVFEDVGEPQTPWLDEHEPIISFASADGRLRVVDLHHGTELPPTGVPVYDAGHAPGSIQLELAPTRDTILVVSNGGMLVRDLISNSDVPVFDRPGYRVWVQHDRSWSVVSAVAHGDPTVRLWSTRDWRPLGSLPGHQGSVLSHAFSADGKRILSVDGTGTLRAWASPAAAWRREVGPTSSAIHQLGIDPIQGGVVSPQSDRARSAMPAGSTVTRAAVCDDGGFTAYADLRGQIAVVPSDENQGARHIAVEGQVSGLRFRPGNGDVILGVCTEDGTLLRIDARTATIVGRVVLRESTLASDLAWSQDGALVAVSFRGGGIVVVDEQGLTRSYRVSEHQIRGIAFLPDGRSIAAIGDSGKLYLLDTDTGRIRKSERLSEHSLFCLATHREGGIVMVGDRGGTVRAVDVHTLRELAAFNARGAVMAMSFVPEQDVLAVAAIDRPVELWDFASLISTFEAVRPAKR